MKVTLESTGQVVVVMDGALARVWAGRTASGIPVTALIVGIGVDRDADTTEFDRELVAMAAAPVGNGVPGAAV